MALRMVSVETGDCTDQHTEADCCTRDCVWVDCEGKVCFNLCNVVGDII